MKQDNALISIIVPIYNIEQYISQCIESLMNQTYKNIEIILVDDGSPDQCPEICDKYAEKDARIKVIHKKNGGLVSARKAGLEQASGAYIGYVDGDDWVEPELYQVLYNAALESKADIIVTGHKRNFLGTTVSIDNTIAGGIYKGKTLEQEIYPRMLYSGLFFQHGISTYVWNKLFKRELLIRNQMQVDDRIFVGEDAACTYPCLLEAESVHIIESNLYHYRQRANSMLKNRDNIFLEYEKLRILYNCLKRRFFESKHYELLLPQLNLFLLSLALIRSGGMLQFSDGLAIFPFKNVEPGNRIVIYSSGTFGQHLFGQMKATDYCEVVLWIDQDYQESKALGLPVSSPEEILSVEYDHVIIASIDETVTRVIKEQLTSIGVPESKLSEINIDVDFTTQILSDLGFEVDHV